MSCIANIRAYLPPTANWKAAMMRFAGVDVPAGSPNRPKSLLEIAGTDSAMPSVVCGVLSERENGCDPRPGALPRAGMRRPRWGFGSDGNIVLPQRGSAYQPRVQPWVSGYPMERGLRSEGTPHKVGFGVGSGMDGIRRSRQIEDTHPLKAGAVGFRYVANLW